MAERGVFIFRGLCVNTSSELIKFIRIIDNYRKVMAIKKTF